MKWEISSISKEYVPAAVTAPHDPTALTVMFAFTTSEVAAGATWYSGSWDGAAVLQSDGTYRAIAQCMVGPGGTVTLAVGSYVVHVKVTDNPEIPAKKAGILKVY
jgi:hypothetical protein